MHKVHVTSLFIIANHSVPFQHLSPIFSSTERIRFKNRFNSVSIQFKQTNSYICSLFFVIREKWNDNSEFFQLNRFNRNSANEWTFFDITQTFPFALENVTHFTLRLLLCCECIRIQMFPLFAQHAYVLYNMEICYLQLFCTKFFLSFSLIFQSRFMYVRTFHYK